MKCPSCSFERSVVIRTVGDTHTVERERQCSSCGFRWKTTEAKSSEIQELLALREAVQRLPGVRNEG